MEILQSKIESLATRLKSIAAEPAYLTHVDKSIRETNLRYNVAYSIAKFIVLAGIPPKPSLAEFQVHLDAYNDEHRTSFTTGWFLQNLWIREINGKVVIPDNVARALDTRHANNVPAEFADAAQCIRSIIIPLYPQLAGMDALQLSPLTETEIDLMVDKRVLVVTHDRYYLSMTDYTRYLRNEIWSSVWLLLCDSQSLKDTRQRVRHYTELILNYDPDLPDRLGEFLNEERRNELHEAALAVLLSENDLLDSGEEFKKSSLDNYPFHRDLFGPVPSIHLTKESVYDLIEQVEYLQKGYQDVFLHNESRGFHTILISLAIVTDLKLGKVDQIHSGTRTMLRDVTRPYIVYNVYWLVKRNYPTALPALLNNDDLAPLFFKSINEIEVDKKIVQKHSEYETHDQIRTATHKLMSEIWADGFEVILYRMSASVDPPDEIVKSLFQILWSQAESVYKKPTQFDQEIHAEEKKRFEDSMRIIAALRPKGRYVGGIKPRIFPRIIERLFQALKSHSNSNRTEFIYLNQPAFEFAIHLHKFAGTPLFPGEVSTDQSNQLKLLQKDIALYLSDIVRDFFTTSSIDVLDFNSGQIHAFKPKWSISTFGFEILEWAYFFLTIDEAELLDSLVSSVESQFVFDAQHPQGLYQDDNQNTYYKVRFLMKAIACGITGLNSTTSTYLAESARSVQVRDRLTNLLTNYSMRFAVDDLANNRVNVFDERFNFTYDLYTNTLLSSVFSAVNLLSEDEKAEFVTQYLQQDNNLARLLGIVNLVEGEVPKRVLHDSLENLSLDEFINSARMITEWRDAMIEAINSDDFFRFAEPLSQRLEAHLTSRKHLNENDTQLLFEVKLIHAFKSKNWEALQAIPIPRSQYHNNTRVNSLKQLFVGLYKLYNDRSYDEAVTIFVGLYSNNTGNAEYAYRLFHARTLAAKLNDDSMAMKYAMDQWNDFSRRAGDEAKKVITTLENNIRYTSMFSFIQFHEFVNLDTALQSLPPGYRYESEIVSGVFESYLKRQLDDLAFEYLSKARQYYLNNSLQVPKVIEDIYSTIDDDKNISRLRTSFSEIFSLPADKMIRTVPGKLNDGRLLDEFILIEVVRAGKILMEKVRALDKITHENKYNDLLQSLLRFRIAVWGWSIPDQGRTGESNSGGDDLGSSDFKIECADECIALIEALILEGKNRAKVEEHVLKCDKYVTHTTRMYVVTYFKGKPDKFVKAWESYQQDVLSLNYSATFKLVKIEFIDHEKVIKKVRNIKAGLTRHEHGVNMYHIFFNIGG